MSLRTQEENLEFAGQYIITILISPYFDVSAPQISIEIDHAWGNFIFWLLNVGSIGPWNPPPWRENRRGCWSSSFIASSLTRLLQDSVGDEESRPLSSPGLTTPPLRAPWLVACASVPLLCHRLPFKVLPEPLHLPLSAFQSEARTCFQSHLALESHWWPAVPHRQSSVIC